MPILNSLISSSIISKLISLGFKTEPSLTITENTSDAANGTFGHALSVSDQHIVVGSPRLFPLSDITIPAVQVYDFSGSELFTLYNPSVGNTAYTSFGNSVGVANNYIIVGDSNYIANSTHRPGRAYVYNTANGALLYTLNNPGASDSSYTAENFGFNVAITNTHIVISSPFEDNTVVGPDNNFGVVYVYSTANGSLLYDIPNPVYPLPDGDLGEFGRAIGASPSYLIIGHPTRGEFDSGHARLYSISNGSLLYTFTNPNDTNNAYTSPGKYDKFGFSVAVTEQFAIVSAPFTESSLAEANNTGRVYVYSTANGSLLHTFTNPYASVNTSLYGNFGYGVSITPSGSKIVVTRQNLYGPERPGNLYLYSK